jgi:hypothetical protein
VLIRAEGAALDATVRLGIRQGMMYRVLGQPVGGSRGSWTRDQCRRKSVGMT